MIIHRLDILDAISLKNLMVLSKNMPEERDSDAGDNDSEDETVGLKEWYVEGPHLKRVTEDYDGGVTASALEYPLMLTFERLFRFIEDPNRVSFGRYTRRDVLRLMEYALETSYHISRCLPDEDSSHRLSYYLQEVDDHHSFLYEAHHKGTICERVLRWVSDRQGWVMEWSSNQVSDAFDEFVEMLASSKQYLYLTPMTEDMEEDDDDNEDNEDSDDNDDNDDSEDNDDNEDDDDDEDKKEC